MATENSSSTKPSEQPASTSFGFFPPSYCRLNEIPPDPSANTDASSSRNGNAIFGGKPVRGLECTHSTRNSSQRATLAFKQPWKLFSSGPSPVAGESSGLYSANAFWVQHPYASQTCSCMGSSAALLSALLSSFGNTTSGPTVSSTETSSSYVPSLFGSVREETTLGGQQTPTRFWKTSVRGGDNGGTLKSISVMPIFAKNSHEELRWEDYQKNNRGTLSTRKPFNKRHQIDAHMTQSSGQTSFSMLSLDQACSGLAPNTSAADKEGNCDARQDNINKNVELSNGHIIGNATSTDQQLPKLTKPGYYTKPSIQELAEKEKADPGFCSRVRDFVIGHYRYGSIEFKGETDVRKFDIDSIVHFDHQEVIVYRDEDIVPRLGKGLNKPAEVTLFNITYFDQTGILCMDGSEKFRVVLRKKSSQCADFLSYNPAKGEWKFTVQHFYRSIA